MSFQKLCLPALAFALLTTSAISAEHRQPAPATASEHYRYHQRGLRLPHELKLMWRQEERAYKKSLPKEQRHGWLKAKWAAMSDSQKHAKIAELQVKWNALPAKVREKLLERKRQWHEARRAQKAERYGTEGGAPASRSLH